jgi:mono/diheme cytochrome c family protein
MNSRVSRLGFAATALFWIGSIAFSGISSADMEIQKQAKAAGVAVDNCAYCHGEKLPKKGASTFNDRGKWLVTEKAKRKAEKVDGAWLKDYPGDKK